MLSYTVVKSFHWNNYHNIQSSFVLLLTWSVDDLEFADHVTGCVGHVTEFVGHVTEPPWAAPLSG